MSSAPLFFFEQTDFSLRLARCADAQRPLRIDELKEVPADEAAGLISTLPANAVVYCAVRPKTRALHLATADEAKQHAGVAGVRKFVDLSSTSGRANTWFAAVQARDGTAPADSPWLLATSSDEHPQTVGTLASLEAKPVRCASAMIATAGALARTAVNPVLLIDVGELTSHAILIGRDGIMAAGGISLDLGIIGEAIQSELGLKFRGSAVKLFFNPEYDFSDVGQRIAARVSPTIKTDLARVVGQHGAPSAIFVSGLAGSQQWLGQQLAAALSIPLHVPDLKAWSASTGVTFATSGAALSSAWYGLFDFINAATRTKPPAAASWVSEWLPVNESTPSATATPFRSATGGTNPPLPPPKPVPPLALKQTSSTAAPMPAMAAASAAAPMTAVATASPLPTAATASPVTAPVTATVVAPAVAPTAAAKAAIAPEPVVVPKPAPEPAQAKAAPTAVTEPPMSTPKYSTKSATSIFGFEPAAEKKSGPAQRPSVAPKLVEPPKPTPAPKPLVTAAMAKMSAPTTPKPFVPTPLPKPPRRKNWGLLGVAVGIAVVLVGAYLLWNSQNEVAAQLTAEKQNAEQKLKAVQAKARLAEQKAHEEAEARKKTEAEFSQKLVDSEAARQQAEAEAVAQTAARLAAARGTLVVTTNPAGATVKVGNLPPATSPATYRDLKIGTYPVTISLPHYEELHVDLVVNENATTDSGVISLNRLAGALKITSEPGVATYELHPANQLMVAPESRLSGSTPASLDDLSPGDYSVTLKREGWTPHTQIVSITRNATTVLRWEWPNGVVKITSTPPGATVSQDGKALGTTPLSLSDQRPGETRYEVTLDHFEPVALVAQVEGGRALELVADFKPEDRFYTADEVDRKPEAISSKQLELPYYLALEGGRADIELTVARDGTAKNLSIAQTTSADLGKFCLAAVAKWQFKPGTKSGKPVNVRITLPFAFKPTKK